MIQSVEVVHHKCENNRNYQLLMNCQLQERGRDVHSATSYKSCSPVYRHLTVASGRWLKKKPRGFKILLVLISLKMLQVTTTTGKFLTSEGNVQLFFFFSMLLYCYAASRRVLSLCHLTITCTTWIQWNLCMFSGVKWPKLIIRLNTLMWQVSQVIYFIPSFVSRKSFALIRFFFIFFLLQFLRVRWT